jgi:hypothetical protein
VECLDANTVQELMAGSMAASQQALANSHLDTCVDCRRLVAAMARSLAKTDPRDRAVSPLEDTAFAAPTGATADGSSRDTPQVLRPGTRVGRYVVAELIGAGGMGVVYRCDDPELNRRVAVKLLRKDLRAAIGEARLLREAQAMARISHQNVIAVHDVGTYEQQVFVAMELVEGESLRAWVKGRVRPVAEIVQVFAAAGRGLAAAHSAGLIHRDFKPDNVLVGTDARVRVTDFGLARVDEEGRESEPQAAAAVAVDEPLTMSGAVIGTPAYMAPEQHRGGHVDARSDQFAFCVALYEALYGERPFAGKTYAELAAEVKAGRVRPAPAGRRVAVPASLRAIVLRGLAVRPGDRFATMDDLLEALGRDRTRVPRTLAWVFLVGAVIAGVGLFADWLVRDRALAVTRISFRAASDQLGRSARLRYDGFVAMADQAEVAGTIRDVAGNYDQHDFGLGTVEDDTAALQKVHDTLYSASFISWAREMSRGVIAVADYKGRLLYTSAAPARWGNDTLVLSAAQLALKRGDGAMVTRGDDKLVDASGVFGDTPRPGLWVLFVHAISTGDAVRALFMQLVEGDSLLADVQLGEGTLLGMVAPDGAIAGSVPPEVARAGAAAPSGEDRLVEIGDDSWLVESVPLNSLNGQDSIARIVLARPIDVGLAGLFVGARDVLGGLLFLLIAASLTSALIARRASSLTS